MRGPSFRSFSTAASDRALSRADIDSVLLLSPALLAAAPEVVRPVDKASVPMLLCATLVRVLARVLLLAMLAGPLVRVLGKLAE